MEEGSHMPDKETENEIDPTQPTQPDPNAPDPNAPTIPDSSAPGAATVPPQETQVPGQPQPLQSEQPVEQSAPNGMTPPFQQTAEQQTPVQQNSLASDPVQDAMKRKQDDLNLAQDLDNGKITPETYGDLFAKRSTLGKLGTMFGLLVGGAGSGLTGQPNVVLEMMNKEIERDLEAQKQTQQNKQNWYNLSLQNQNTQADVAIKQAQALATNTGTDLKQEDVNFAHWKNTQAGVYKMAAGTQAYNSAALAFLHDQQQMVNKIPPGPQQTNAQNHLNNIVNPYFMNKINDNWNTFENKKAAVDALVPNPIEKAMKDNANKQQANAVSNLGANEDVVDRDKYNQAVQLGRFTPEAPGAIRPDQVTPLNSAIMNLTANRQNYSIARKAVENLGNQPTAGQVPAASIASGILGGIGNSLGSSFGGGSDKGGGSLLGNTASGAGIEAKKYFENERTKTEADLLNRGIPQAELDSYLPRYNDNAETKKTNIERLNAIFKNRDAQYGVPFNQYPGMWKPLTIQPINNKSINRKNNATDQSSSEEPTSRWDAFVKKMSQ